MSRYITGYGEDLNRKWGVNARHALYREDGKFYMNLKYFPGALFDAKGYVVFGTEQEYLQSPYIHHGIRVNIPQGISTISGYVKVVT